jgi:predicted short-subunit dehydrogenase-like oxidoreductase (DUF2520 family)
VGAVAVSLQTPLPTDCDLLLLAVKDDALAEVVALHATLPLPETLILAHTSGSVPLSVLAPARRPHGVLYPLQTFTRGRPVDWQSIPLLLEADSETTRHALHALARRLGPRVETLDSETRKRVHLGAVFASNFVNHLLHIAGRVGGDYRRYLPLLTEVVGKLRELNPHQAQTGPAKRGDLRILQEHISLLATEHPAWLPLYEWMSNSILETHSAPSSGPDGGVGPNAG